MEGADPFSGPVIVLKDSICAISPELSVFDLPSTDCSTFSSSWIPYFPIYPINNSHAPIEFSVTAEGSYYIDLHNSYVVATCRVVKADGTVIPPTELTAVDNNTFHNLWEDVIVQLNSTVVAETNSLYPFVAFTDRLLRTSVNDKNGVLKSEHWFPPEKQGVFTLADAGFKQRHKLTGGSKKFVVSGRPVSSLFEQKRYLVPGSTLRLTLKRNTPERILVTSVQTEDKAYKVEVLKCTFFVCKKIILRDTLESHKKQLALGKNIVFPCKDLIIRQYTIPSGINSFESDSLIMGK